MICQSRAYTATVFFVAAFSMGMLVYASAFAAGDHLIMADVGILHAVAHRSFGDGSPADLKADIVLIDRVYESSSVPGIAELRGAAFFHGVFSDRQGAGSVNRAALQNAFLDGMAGNTAADESLLRRRRFSMLPAIDPQVDDAEPKILFDHPDGIDTREDKPALPTLQDNNLLGGTKDASIIAVQVLTLFDDKNKGGGDLDLYVGLNSLFDADGQQDYGLLQPGQALIGGITWTF